MEPNDHVDFREHTYLAQPGNYMTIYHMEHTVLFNASARPIECCQTPVFYEYFSPYTVVSVEAFQFLLINFMFLSIIFSYAFQFDNDFAAKNFSEQCIFI